MVISCISIYEHLGELHINIAVIINIVLIVDVNCNLSFHSYIEEYIAFKLGGVYF